MRTGRPDSRLTARTGNTAAMPIDPEDLQTRKKLPDIVLGEDISALSAHELEARIARLQEEIARCQAAIEARHATKSAAESFFKR